MKKRQAILKIHKIPDSSKFTVGNTTSPDITLGELAKIARKLYSFEVCVSGVVFTVKSLRIYPD